MQFLNIFLFWLFFGLLCSVIAKKRDKNPFIWFFIGLFLGLFGVLLLIVLCYVEHKKNSGRSFRVKPPKELPVQIPSPPPQASQLWYYLDNNREPKGPIGLVELSSLWNEKYLSEQSYLWSEGMHEWTKIHELSEIFAELKKNNTLLV